MIKRKDYIDKKVSHEEYYSQFVNEGVKKLVKDHFTLEKLKTHFNSDMFGEGYIKLKRWDKLGESLKYYVSSNKIKEADENYSKSTIVCILKQAASMVLEDEQNNGGNIDGLSKWWNLNFD